MLCVMFYYLKILEESVYHALKFKNNCQRLSGLARPFLVSGIYPILYYNILYWCLLGNIWWALLNHYQWQNNFRTILWTQKTTMLRIIWMPDGHQGALQNHVGFNISHPNNNYNQSNVIFIFYVLLFKMTWERSHVGAIM